MVLIKVMKRKDASSIFVAIVLAMIVIQLLAQLTVPLTALFIPEAKNLGGPMFSLTDSYLQPVLWAVLQIALFEVLSLVYTSVLQLLRQNKRHK